MNHKNFHFTQIPDKTNYIIFLKSSKTMFLGIFDHFWSFLSDRDFFQKNPALSHNYISTPEHHAKFQKKLITRFQENLRTDRRTDGSMDRPYFIGPFQLTLGVQ